MSDMVMINLDDAPIIIEKRGRGYPRGSKNKVKIPAVASTSTVPVKLYHGRPLGRKNKKSSAAVVVSSAALDLSLELPVLPQRSSGSTFCFFTFADAQRRERQRLPLKFAEYMNDHEITEAILQEASSGEPPYEVEIHYDSEGNVSFNGGWPRFAVDHDLHQG
jgi:hypothetical protein